MSKTQVFFFVFLPQNSFCLHQVNTFLFQNISENVLTTFYVNQVACVNFSTCQ